MRINNRGHFVVLLMVVLLFASISACAKKPVAKVGQEDVLGIWALRYDEEDNADIDFSLVRELTEDNCGSYVTSHVEHTGVIRCNVGYSYNKILLNGFWIIDIVAFEGTEYSPEILVEKVCNALVIHWTDIAKP